MNIEIDTEILNRDIATMTDRKDALSNAIAEMYTAIDNLNSMWEGSAHDVFAAEAENHRVMFENLIQQIQNLISCMEYARSEYDSCESEVDSLIASISV